MGEARPLSGRIRPDDRPEQRHEPARTEAELEEFLLFCVVVAGKNADQQAAKLERFLGGRRPFAYLRSSERREPRGDGCGRCGWASTRSCGGASASSRTPAPTCGLRLGGPDALPGIGIKTAKFFVLHSRPERDARRPRHPRARLDARALGAGGPGGLPCPALPAGPRRLPVLGDRVLRDGVGPPPRRRGARSTGRASTSSSGRSGAGAPSRPLGALDQLDLVALGGVDEGDHRAGRPCGSARRSACSPSCQSAGTPRCRPPRTPGA
jgi:hypothetical protein